MILKKEIVDQRKLKRYRVPTDSFVSLGSHGPILGQIIDISMGGLAFRYINSRKPTDESYMEIFLTEGNLYLGSVPFKTSSDYEIPNTVLCKVVDPIPPRSLAMKRCGVEFGELTTYQKNRLEYFIQNHTIGEV